MKDLGLEDGVIRGTLDLKCYRLTAVKKAAYRMAARCAVQLTAISADEVAVVISSKQPIGEEQAASLRHAFLQELLDQELREQIGEETAALRTLILAQAFSKTDLIRED